MPRAKSTQDFGVVGLAVMGQNLALNVEAKGFSVAVYNRTVSRTKEFLAGPAKGKHVLGATSIPDFVASLKKPRRILLMVQAGSPVDEVLAQLRPHLEKGDILIDGGNSYYKDTVRRQRELEPTGLRFIGSGISGGEAGALHGPCIMPGGPREAYDQVEPILAKIAAETEDGPCVTYIGPGGSGHYVKMVHNGIEYGVMACIAEVYDLLARLLGISALETGRVFGEWNQGELGSYLLEITEAVLGYVDPETRQPLVDLILDQAGQKGTGKWASQDALDVGVPIPTIDAAVTQRILSAFKKERVEASELLPGPAEQPTVERDTFIGDLRDALLGSVVTTYAQGMTLLRWASDEYNFDLNFAEIARIWKGGCIIRARLLDPIKDAFTDSPDLVNLMVAPYFRELLAQVQVGWRRALATAIAAGVPAMALGVSLAYFDCYRSAHLPANLTQAQRDYFGAHTYQRLDRKGTFHTQWEG
jgi:6-phosphogluconate dehydrogenase